MPTADTLATVVNPSMALGTTRHGHSQVPQVDLPGQFSNVCFSGRIVTFSSQTGQCTQHNKAALRRAQNLEVA